MQFQFPSGIAMPSTVSALCLCFQDADMSSAPSGGPSGTRGVWHEPGVPSPVAETCTGPCAHVFADQPTGKLRLLWVQLALGAARQGPQQPTPAQTAQTGEHTWALILDLTPALRRIALHGSHVTFAHGGGLPRPQ